MSAHRADSAAMLAMTTRSVISMMVLDRRDLAIERAVLASSAASMEAVADFLKIADSLEGSSRRELVLQVDAMYDEVLASIQEVVASVEAKTVGRSIID